MKHLAQTKLEKTLENSLLARAFLIGNLISLLLLTEFLPASYQESLDLILVSSYVIATIYLAMQRRGNIPVVLALVTPLFYNSFFLYAYLPKYSSGLWSLVFFYYILGTLVLIFLYSFVKTVAASIRK